MQAAYHRGKAGRSVLLLFTFYYFFFLLSPVFFYTHTQRHGHGHGRRGSCFFWLLSPSVLSSVSAAVLFVRSLLLHALRCLPPFLSRKKI